MDRIRYDSSALVEVPFDEKLIYAHELFFYDRPLVSIFKDSKCGLYIGHFIDYPIDAPPQSSNELWYMTKVEVPELKKMLKGEICLRTAIDQAAVKYIVDFEHVLEVEGGETVIHKVYDGKNAPEGFLPELGFKSFDDEFNDLLIQVEFLYSGKA